MRQGQRLEVYQDAMTPNSFDFLLMDERGRPIKEQYQPKKLAMKTSQGLKVSRPMWACTMSSRSSMYWRQRCTWTMPECTWTMPECTGECEQLVCSWLIITSSGDKQRRCESVQGSKAASCQRRRRVRTGATKNQGLNRVGQRALVSVCGELA